MKVVCVHCGLPFATGRAAPVGPVFCCSGCALAHRLSSATPGEAVSPVIVPAVGVLFLVFNQGLAALLARLAPQSAAFVAGSLIAGGLAWGALVFFQRALGAWRASDRVAALVALIVWAVATARLTPGAAVAGNLGLLLWSMRGLARKSARAKK